MAGALVSLLLLGVSGALIDGHLRAWRAARVRHEEGSRGWRYHRGRTRRRLTASGLIGAVGAVIAVGPLAPREPAWMLGYLGVLLSATSAIGALGLFDAAAAARNYGFNQREETAAALERLREEMANKHNRD